MFVRNRTIVPAVFALAFLLTSSISHAASANWTGLADSTWANTGNWDASPVPATGDNATFNGAGNGNTTIDLGAGVTVANIIFDNSIGAAYTVGAGTVGSQTVTVQNGLAMYGGSAFNQTVNANVALASTTTNVIYYNDSANTVTFAGTNYAGTAGIKSIQANGNGNISITGPIVSGTGTMNLEKLGTGTLTLSGGAYWSGTGVNSYIPGTVLAPVVLRSGNVILSSGVYTNLGEFVVGGVIANGGAGNNVTFTMNNSASLGLSSGNYFSLCRGNGIGGVSSDVILNNNSKIISPNVSLGYNGNSTANLPKGTFTMNDSSAFLVNGNFYIAESAGADITMTLNGTAGFTNLNGLGVRVSSSGNAKLILNGGIFQSEGDVVIGYSTAAPYSAAVIVNGGTLKVATTTKRWLQIGRGNANNSTAPCSLIVSNGTVQLDQNTDIRFSSSPTANYSQGSNTLSIEGGNINFYVDNATTIGGSGQLDLMQNANAAAVNTVNLDAGTITVSNVVSSSTSGTRVFNFNGGTLKAASAAASGSVNFFNLGSGNATANVRNGGAVIDSNGKNITITQPLLHSVIAGDNAVDGGLTKNGTGALTVSGVNTYTGVTRVNAGTLNITGTSLNSQSVVVSDGATLGLSAPNGASWVPTSVSVGTSTGAAILNLNAVSTTVAPLAPGALTFTGTGNTINVTGGITNTGTYPLIASTSPIVGTYTAGTLPAGVTGSISTSGNSIVLTVTAVNITNNIWTGAVNGTWDATTANWTNSALGNTYSDGSTVQFDDTGLNTATITNVAATTFAPANILVTNSTKNYAFKANTIISGNTGITKTGTGSLTNSTANTYTGPTVINKGALVVGVASTANVNGALGLNSAVTLANDPTATLNLNGNSTQVGSLSGGGPNAGNVVLGAGTLTFGLNNSSTAYGGNISGTGGLTKLGTGTMTFSGTNAYSGVTAVSQGTVTYSSGAVSGATNTFSVGTAAGFGTATMNVNSGSTVNIAALSHVGYLTGVGVLNLNGGAFTNNGELRVGSSDQSGYGPNGFGTLNMTTGTATVGALTIAYGNNAQNSVSGIVNIYGGTLNSSNDVLVGYAGSGKGTLNISSGATLNVGTTSAKWLRFGQWDTTTSEMNINGTLNLNWGSSIKYNQNNSSGAHTINQNGGAVISYSDFATTVGGAGNLDLMYADSGGGAATNTYNLNGGILTIPAVASTRNTGTRLFNFNGGTLRPTTNSTTFFNLGTGNAYANVRNGGAIIDSAGYNLTIAQSLQHSTINGDNSTDGGFTKVGAGTLIMTGNLSYNGPTRVLGGTLSLSPAYGLNMNSDLVMSGSTLALGLSGGGQFPVGSIFLTNGTISLSYGTITFNPSSSAISGSGSLTRSGTTTINISGTGLGIGIIPLITIPGLNSTNGFVIGSLPTGVNAVLTNSVSGELDLFVTSAGQLLLWHGTYDGTAFVTNWDINVSTNWYDSSFNLAMYLQYAGNTVGDNVIFGDNGYNTDGTNRVNLVANVVPATVEFYTSAPYILAGSGGIGGSTSVVLTNVNNTIYLLTSNSYTGGTVIGSGVLAITNDSALGANTGGVTLGGGTLQFNGSVTSGRSVAVNANSSIGVTTNASAQVGSMTGVGGLTKLDNGTLVLPGTNSFGALVVQQGAVTSSGSNTISALPIVGNLSGYNGVLNITSGAFQDIFTPAQVYNSSLTIGNVAGSAGSVNMTAGTLTVPRQLTVGPTSYGSFSQSGGSTTIGGFIALGGTASGGVFNQTGGTINVTNSSVTIGYVASTALATMNLGGNAVFNVSGTGNGLWPGEVGTGTLNVSGSAAVSVAANGVILGKANTAAIGTANLLGGTLTVNSVSRGTGSGFLNFNGGALKANAASTTFMAGLNSANVFAGGAVIDDGGYAITIGQPLLAPDGYGVSSIALSDGGSGYIAPPIVTISGGAGSNATAVATVSGGSVTGITITSPGISYTSADSLSVSFAGGGASVVAPTVSAVNLAPNTSGGLVKRGSGTLTLSGTNNYSGPTMVTNGTMLLTPAYQAGGAVTVANGAAFGVIANSVSNSATVGAVTLGSSGAATLDFNYGFSGNPTNAALTAGAVTLNGSSAIAIGGNFSLGSFPVLKYASLSGAFNSTVTAPRGMVATVSNDVPDKTIYVVVTSLSSAIVWTGTNALPGKTNLWDLNTTTNWLISGAPTTYQETLPPGDAVLFNDSGSGTVLLSNTASPASMTISNSALDYVFQGSGQINAIAGLTKIGAGTVTLNVPGTYSVSTVVSNGTLALGTNQTFVNLAGNGTMTNSSGSPTVTVNNSANTTFAGGVQGTLGVTKTGNSTLTLTGTNNFSGNFFGKGGTVVIDSGAVNGGTLWTSIGQDGTDNATLTLKGTGSFTNSADFNVGDIGSAAGTLNISNNATLTVGSVYIGSANVAGSTASGTVNQDGGAVRNTLLVIGGRTSTNGVGVYNMSGGTVTGSGSVRIGGVGTGTMNMSGTSAASFVSDSYVGYRTGKGTLNMTGGSLSIGGDFRVAGSDANGTQYNATGVVQMANATINASSLTIARGNNNQNAVSGEVYVNTGATFTSTNDVIIGFAGTGHGKLALNGGVLNVGVTNTKWLIIPFYDTTTGEIDLTNGTLNLNAGSAIRFSIGNTSTAGTPNVINQKGGNVTFYSDFATTIGGGGVLDLAYSGAAGVVNTYNLDGGTLTVPQVASTTTGPTRVFNFNGGTLKAAGSSTAFFNLGGGNAFAYVRTGGAIIDTWSNSVTIAQPLINNGIEEDGGLTKIGNGTLLLDGVNTYTNVTTVNAGLLGGSGTIAGGLVVNSGGGVAPGDGVGTLTINGNITLNAGSTNVFEVNGSTLAHDTIAAGGTVAYGGVLEIVTSGTFTNGQTFTLFSGAGAANASNFSAIQVSPASGTVFSFTNGVLTVVTAGAASQPVITSIGISGSTLTISGTNGTSGQQFRVLSSTNLTLPIAGWTPIYTNTFTGSPFNVTLPLTLTVPQDFYMISIP